jgi:hypothetical protein
MGTGETDCGTVFQSSFVTGSINNVPNNGGKMWINCVSHLQYEEMLDTVPTRSWAPQIHPQLVGSIPIPSASFSP